MIAFENTYAELPAAFYKKCAPAKFPTPKLISFNHELAKDLGIDSDNASAEELALIFSGQKLLPGSDPIAMAYAGFQFGHPVPELGDGRALLLGESSGHDIQLKGSGQTPFSRRGDGRSTLGSAIREYVVSEFMHALGVKTSRGLSLVITGEQLHRQFGQEPGAVFTRVSASHIRVGTFQYFYFKNDYESIQTLLDYTINRHYPKLRGITNNQDRIIGLLKSFTKMQAKLVASWSSLGFIHGVMNTDNFSLAGITIDYGPCAFMEEFNLNQVFSSIDQHARYAYSNQENIAKWNILRLAECFLPLIHEDQKKAIEMVENEVVPLFDEFKIQRLNSFARKLGIQNFQASDEKIISSFLEYLQNEKLDFTLAFRNLSQLYSGATCFYPQTDEFKNFKEQWEQRAPDPQLLSRVNPLYIPRNHLIQRVIDNAYKGDFQSLDQILELLNKPYEEQVGMDGYELPAKEHERVVNTYCGT